MTPEPLMLELLRRANHEADLDVAENELLHHHRTEPFKTIIEAAYTAGAAAEHAQEQRIINP